jgi:3-oxoadipate enol-lactonase
MRTLITACAALLFSATLFAQNGGAQKSADTPPLPPGPGSFLQVEGSRIYYEECGASPQTVVLIHDGILHSAVWDDVWPDFCKHFHTIRYDRRGYGRSPVFSSWHSETDDLNRLLRHLKVSRAVLVGSSHGGELSIDFTLEHPEIVQQLVLVGAVVSGFPYSRHFLDRGTTAYEFLEKGDVKSAVAQWANDKYLIAHENTAARKKLFDLLSANPQDLSHPELALPAKPAFGRLQEIKVPTLILVGDEDIPDVHAHAGAIEAGIPRARRVVVSGTGHLMYLEKPREFSNIVIPFIEENSY